MDLELNGLETPQELKNRHREPTCCKHECLKIQTNLPQLQRTKVSNQCQRRTRQKEQAEGTQTIPGNKKQWRQ